MRPCVIDEDPAHDIRRDAEEVRAALARQVPLIDQPQVCLVDKRRRLQRV
jgi:hypothetical protein